MSEPNVKKIKKQGRYGGKVIRQSERAMREKEGRIPKLGKIAVQKAYEKALHSGFSVMQTEGNKIIEVFPNGSRLVVKNIEPPVSVKYGQKLLLSRIHHTETQDVCGAKWLGEKHD